MSKKTKNIAQAVAPEVAAETTTIEQENLIEALVPALEEAEADATTEPTKEAIVEAVVEAKKRVRGYAQSALSLEDLARLSALKEHIKSSLNVTVSNQTIITAALDALAHDEHMKAFLTSLVTTAADRQRAKDLKAYEALRAKLEPVAELAKA